MRSLNLICELNTFVFKYLIYMIIKTSLYTRSPTITQALSSRSARRDMLFPANVML